MILETGDNHGLPMRPRFERPDTLFAHQLLRGDVIVIADTVYELAAVHRRLPRGVELRMVGGETLWVDEDLRIRTISRVDR